MRISSLFPSAYVLGRSAFTCDTLSLCGWGFFSVSSHGAIPSVS